MPSKSEIKCWVCGENSIPFENSKSLDHIDLGPDKFKISDSEYGKSLPRYRCIACSFIQCDTPIDMVSFYQAMSDDEYDQGEVARQRQFEDLIRTFKIAKGSKWLDVGCGTGALVEMANKMEYRAIGIDPSIALIEKGLAKGRPISCATLENFSLGDELFDVISLIDVIEHVNNPIAIMSLVSKHLKPNGFVCLSTPDASSIFARALKMKWWHVRVAHIGYFDKKTLSLTFRKNGFEILRLFRPNWYFDSNYFVDRLSKYLPFIPKKLLKTLLRDRVIRINLRDSWAVVGQKSA
jgi:2-polyprenyl-3-methyl-5-hydroxy-6-metoxy-1,4-benzoquinol methylase